MKWRTYLKSNLNLFTLSLLYFLKRHLHLITKSLKFNSFILHLDDQIIFKCLEVENGEMVEQHKIL